MKGFITQKLPRNGRTDDSPAFSSNVSVSRRKRGRMHGWTQFGAYWNALVPNERRVCCVRPGYLTAGLSDPWHSGRRANSIVCATSNHSLRIESNRYVLTTGGATPQIAVLYMPFGSSLASTLVDSGRCQLDSVTGVVPADRRYRSFRLFFWDQWGPERLKLDIRVAGD